jgi:hypothetical protein
MDANEGSPRASARLNRVKAISQVLKILFPLYLLTVGYFPFVHRTPDGFWMVWGTYATIAEAPIAAKLIVVLGAGILLAAVVTCYQLLNLYAKGIIFSARNVSLLGRIGYLALGYGALKWCGPLLMSAWYHWIGVSFGSSSMSFVSLKLFVVYVVSLLGSPWIIGGFFAVLIAYIMGEGCKIQEEQELTV